jgi:hypothetical protein
LSASGPARQIIKRGHRAKGQGSFDAALNGLMVHPDGPGDRKKGSVLPVGEQHSRPLDPARQFRPRPRHRSQPGHLLLTQRQLDRLPPPRHDLNPRLRSKAARLQPMSAKMNPPHMMGFNESMN